MSYLSYTGKFDTINLPPGWSLSYGPPMTVEDDAVPSS